MYSNDINNLFLFIIFNMSSEYSDISSDNSEDEGEEITRKINILEEDIKEKNIIILTYRYLYESEDINKTFDDVYEFYISLENVYNDEIWYNINILNVLYEYIKKHCLRDNLRRYEKLIKKLYHIINENIKNNDDKKLSEIKEYYLTSYMLNFPEDYENIIKEKVLSEYFNISDNIPAYKYDDIIYFIETQPIYKLKPCLKRYNVFNQENIKMIAWNKDLIEFYITI